MQENVATITPEMGLRGVKFVSDPDAMASAMGSGSTELALAPVNWSEASQIVRRRLRMRDPLPGLRVKGRRLPLNAHSDTHEVAADLVTRFFAHDPDQVAFISDLAHSLKFIQVGIAGGIGGGIGVRLESIPVDFNPFMHNDRGLMTGTVVISGTPMQAELKCKKTNLWNIYKLPEDHVQMWPGNHNFLGAPPLRHMHGGVWQGHDDRFILNALRDKDAHPHP